MILNIRRYIFFQIAFLFFIQWKTKGIKQGEKNYHVTCFTQCMHATHAWQRCTERGCRRGHRLIAFQLLSFNLHFSYFHSIIQRNCFSYEAVSILQRQFHSAAINCIKLLDFCYLLWLFT